MAATDPESGLLADVVKYAVGSSPGASDETDWTTAPPTHTLQFSAFQGTYFVTVHATNGAGLHAHEVTSQPIIIDGTPPKLFVDDVKERRNLAGWLFWPSTTTLPLSLTASDSESGIDHIEVNVYGVNSTPHPSGNPRSVGEGVSAFGPELSVQMVNGGVYFMVIEAINGAQMKTTYASPWFLVDDTAPVCVATAVRDGDGSIDLDTTSVMDRVAANWECDDAESHIASTLWSAECVSGACAGKQLVPVRDVGKASAGIVNGIDMQEGWRVISRLRVTNGAGLSTDWLTSDGITYTRDAGVAEAVIAVSTTDIASDDEIELQRDTGALAVKASGFDVGEQCEFTPWCVRNEQTGGLNVLKTLKGLPGTAQCNSKWTMNPPSAAIASLAHHDMCFTTVRPSSDAGRMGSRPAATTRAVQINSTRAWPIRRIHVVTPVAPGTSDKTADIVLEVDLSWHAWRLTTLSAIIYASDGAHHLQWQEPSSGDFRYTSGTAFTVPYTIDLDKNPSVYIFAGDRAGEYSQIQPAATYPTDSPRFGVMGDTAFSPLLGSHWPSELSSPSAPVPPNAKYTYSAKFTDDRYSKVLLWRWFDSDASSINVEVNGYGSPAMALRVTGDTDTAWGAYCQFSSTPIHDEHELYTTDAIVMDAGVGNHRYDHSPGYYVDTSPPLFVTHRVGAKDLQVWVVRDTLGEAQDTASQVLPTSVAKTPATIAWDVDDPESGLSVVKVDIGTAPHGTDLLKGHYMDPYVRSLRLDSALVPGIVAGETVFVTVQARNQAGLWAEQASGNLTIDDTPPVVRVHATTKNTQGVHHLLRGRPHRVSSHSPGSDVAYTVAIGDFRGLGGEWAAYDPESTIASQEWCVGTEPHLCDVKDWQLLDITKGDTFADFDGDFHSKYVLDGASAMYAFYFSVRVKNTAGMASTAHSVPVMVDATPPEDPETRFPASHEHVLATTVDADVLQGVTSSLTVRWLGVADRESGIRAYAVWAQHVKPECDNAANELKNCGIPCSDATPWWDEQRCLEECASHQPSTCFVATPRFVDNATLQHTWSDLDLAADGDEYTAHVVALNGAEMSHVYTPSTFHYSTAVPGMVPGSSIGFTMTQDNGVSTRRADLSVCFQDGTYDIVEWQLVRYLGGLAQQDIKFLSLATDGVVSSHRVEASEAHDVVIGTAHAPDGEKLILRAQARSSSGYDSEVCFSDTFTQDTTPPRAGLVTCASCGLGNAAARVGQSAEMVEMVHASEVHSNHTSVPTRPSRADAVVDTAWERFTDEESLIKEYEVCWWVEPLPVGLGCCDHDHGAACTCHPVTATPPTCTTHPDDSATFESRAYQHSYTTPGDGHLHPHLQVVTVAAKTDAGLVGTSHQFEVIVDTTGPSWGVALDGPTAHVNLEYTIDNGCIAGTHSKFQDPESGILGYLWKPYKNDVALTVNQWVGLTGSMKQCGFTLAEGDVVKIAVTAVNRAGHASAVMSSGAVVLPNPPIVHTNAAPSMRFVAAATGANGGDPKHMQLGVNWAGVFASPEARYMSFEWTICDSELIGNFGVGIAPEACAGPFVHGSGTETSAVWPNLQHGTAYKGVVRATTHAGLSTTVATSDHKVVDTTPPIVFNANHSLANNVDRKQISFQADTAKLHVWWITPRDSETGITSLEIEVLKTAVDDTESVVQSKAALGNPPSVPPPTFYVYTASLEHAHTYRVKLYATNGAGMQSVSKSVGVTVDATPPQPGDAFAGFKRSSSATYNDLDTQGVQASWTPFMDEESGVTVSVKSSFCCFGVTLVDQSGSQYSTCCN